MANIRKVRAEINKMKPRSAWNKGVQKYALELLDKAISHGYKDVPDEKAFLCGAGSWHNYSYGGLALIPTADVVERLATKSEIKKYNDGKLEYPNPREDWFDCQTRALRQAYWLIRDTNSKFNTKLRLGA